MLHTIMSLDDMERHAYASGDVATAEMIRLAQDDAADACASTMSPEHEAAVDNLNRMRKALEACVEAMSAADTALTLHDDEEKPYELPESFAEALSEAEAAIKADPYSYDDTLRERLRKVEAERDSMRGQLAEAQSEVRVRSHVFYTAEALLRPYRGKPKAPKWADRLRLAVNMHRGPQGIRY